MIGRISRFVLLAGVVAAVANSAYGQIATINFETEDDFLTPLVHGQSVYSTPRPNHANPFVPFASDTVLEFGNLFNLSSTVIGGDGHLGPAIFDSDPADTTSTDDPDLLVGLGNILILHRDEGPNTTLHPTQGLVFNHPNDEADFGDRGSLVLDFLIAEIHPISIDLIDVDRGVHMDVILTDNLGRTRTYDVPSNWTTDVTVSPVGWHTLSLETLMNQPAAPNATGNDATASQDEGFNDQFVLRLEVQIVGRSPSGGIDNLVVSSRLIPEPGTLVLGALAAACLLTFARGLAFSPRTMLTGGR